MFRIKVCSKVQEGGERQSRVGAREVQLVVEILHVMGRVKLCVVDEQWAVRGGNGRLSRLQKEEDLAHSDSTPFQRKVVIKSVRVALEHKH